MWRKSGDIVAQISSCPDARSLPPGPQALPVSVASRKAEPSKEGNARVASPGSSGKAASDKEQSVSDEKSAGASRPPTPEEEEDADHIQCLPCVRRRCH